jgi:hypothetical protein
MSDKPDVSVLVDRDGWHYGSPPAGGDARKIVSLVQDGMAWVGIRAWDAQKRRWLNGGEPERATILAWRPLHEPAKGRWKRGQLILPENQEREQQEALEPYIEKAKEKFTHER